MTKIRSLHDPTGVALAAGLALLVSVACGYAVSRLDERAFEGAPKWLLIALLGVGSISVIAWAVRHGELLSPLGVTAMVFLAFFVVRPIHLLVDVDALLFSSYEYRATPLQYVTDLNAQEIKLYVDTHLEGSFDAAVTRALAVQALLFVALLVGYRMEAGRRLARRASRVGTQFRQTDVPAVVAGGLAIGLLGELVIFTQIGGVGSAVNQLGTHGSLGFGFAYLVLLTFYIVGLVVWGCLQKPTSRVAKVGFILAVVQLSVFLGLLGSRTLVFVPGLLALIAVNELGRPLRFRVLAPLIVLAVLFSAGYLGVRQDPSARSIPGIARAAPEHALNVQIILNSSPLFDQVLAATNYVPSRADYRYGGELVQGLLGQVPSFLYPGKAESNDISFRKLLWGERFGAGRPIGAAGEFYRDFGFAGVAVGGVLLGILARGLGGLRARAGGPEGRRLRVALFALGMLLLYEFLVGSYSLVFGSALQLAIPFSLAMVLMLRRA